MEVKTSIEESTSKDASNEPQSESVEGVDDPAVNETLTFAAELLDAVKKEMKMHALHSAILLLEDALENGGHEGERHKLVRWHLSTALLIRFAINGWIEDLETCRTTLDGTDTIFKLARIFGTGAQQIEEVQFACELIQECRESIDVANIETILCVTEEALCNEEILPSDKAKFLSLLGRTLVMKYLRCHDVEVLDQAALKYSDMAPLCTEDDPRQYISLMSRAQIGCFKYLELLDPEGLEEMDRCMPKANELDREATQFFAVGMELLEDTSDESNLQKAVACLSASLSNRISPHPYRAQSSSGLAIALLTRFQVLGDPQDLEIAIILQSETLYLRPSNHPRRGWSLNNLANVLSARFKYQGKLQDLEVCIALHREALSLRPLSHPDRPVALNNLAGPLINRFEHTGNVRDLEDGVDLLRESIPLLPASNPHYSLSRSNLAAALLTLFKQNGDLGQIKECIQLLREALTHSPSHHPNYPTYIHLLANALLIQFEHEGNPADLKESVVLLRKVLNLQSSSHIDNATTVKDLASVLSTQFDQDGDVGDLEESINILKEVASSQNVPHSARSECLNALGHALSRRFDEKGDFRDLEECIELRKAALSITPETSADRPMYLNNLASALCARYEQKGSFLDLEQSVMLCKAAIGSLPASSPQFNMFTGNMSTFLVKMYQHGGGLDHLEEAISLLRKVLSSHPVPHPDRCVSLSNLATPLVLRFNRTGDIQDIEEAITLLREMLSIMTASHPNRPSGLCNLAAALSSYAEKRADLQSLEECISLYEQSFSLHAADNPYRLSSYHNLANALCLRFHFTHNDADVTTAMKHYETAAKFETGSLLARLDSSITWARRAQQYSPSLALNAYQYSIDLLPLLASMDLSLEQRQDVLTHSRSLVGDATKWAIQEGRFETAILFLSTGRSVFWTQTLQLRTPVDEVATASPELAEKLRDISRKLEQASHSTGDSISRFITADPREERGEVNGRQSLYDLTARRQHIIEEIRTIPGFQQFLLPPTFTSLKDAAQSGPIVLLNVGQLGCDALILHNEKHVQHVPFPDLQRGDLATVKELMDGVREGRSVSQTKIDEIRKLLPRDMIAARPSQSEACLKEVLEVLWIQVVNPIIQVLGLRKTDKPNRIWWCPTGPFAFLPIHAAGIYFDDEDSAACLSDYAISSYCTTPQDLLNVSLPASTMDFKMLAVIEPEAPNANPLPMTLEELRRIEDRVPDIQNQLIAHVGSRTSPTPMDRIVADIQGSSIVHFGCHGVQNLVQPLESHLLLSGGKLSMARIIKECQVSNASLAYLSACETAKGDEQRPDESLNLVATMMFAGFRSVVGTMWSIFDDDAPVVADVFYNHLFRLGKDAPLDVRDTAYALHLATKKLRELGKPLKNWVPYVHYGI